MPGRACERAGEGLCTSTWGDRTRGNGFQTERGEIQIRYKEEIFYDEGGETLAQVSQRGARCPICGNVQVQVGQGSEHLIWLKMSLLTAGGLDYMILQVPSTPNYSMIL